LAVAGSLWLAAGGTAQATTGGKLDANFQPFTFNVQVATNRGMLAQTFKAVTTGQIDQVSLPVAVPFGGSGDIYIVPVDAATGKPLPSYSSTAHYSGFVNCCTWVDYTLSPKFSVNANTQYAIVVMPSALTFSWTITITAGDSGGLKTSTTFSTVVGSKPPTVAIHGAPASGPEGTSIALTASATSGSAEDNKAGFSYSWSATKNGTFYGSGSGASF